MGCTVAGTDEVSVLLEGLQAPVMEVRLAALKVGHNSHPVLTPISLSGVTVSVFLCW